MIKDVLLDILFPKTCLACGREGKYICDKCQVFLSESMPACPVCGYPSLKGETHLKHLSSYEIDGLTSLWDYEGLVKELINMIKNQGVTDIIREIVDRIEIAKDVCVTYVPLELKRQKLRGFNQAELIAREVAKINHCKLVNMFEKKDIGIVEKVLLVDDFFVTGNTIRECARILKQAGVNKVWGFVLAKQV